MESDDLLMNELDIIVKSINFYLIYIFHHKKLRLISPLNLKTACIHIMVIPEISLQKFL